MGCLEWMLCWSLWDEGKNKDLPGRVRELFYGLGDALEFLQAQVYWNCSVFSGFSASKLMIYAI